jgi:ABC-2 type transport system ATP-binding protein
LLQPTSGKAEIFGLDVQRDTVAAHRRLVYVAGETSLWPSLTGKETLHLLGRVQGRVDPTYRDELVERFAFDPSRRSAATPKATAKSSA